MGSQWRFPACAMPTLFLFPSSAVSSPTSWYLFALKNERCLKQMCQVIHNKAEWTKWEDILNTNASLPRDVYAGNMIIPTLDTVR